MSLFHYTDLAAIVSILQTRKLWLSDLRYLNDRTEFYHGIERLLKGMQYAPHGLFADENYTQPAVEILQQHLNKATGYGLNLDPLFLCSLSSAENLLSQWRGYGQYAIEFHEDVLRSEIPGIHECIYGLADKNRFAPDVITDAITNISKSLAVSGGMGLGAIDALSKVMEMAATFKDEGFAEEREFRIIAGGAEESFIKYRIKNNLLIPYIEMPISLNCIKAIHIGPMNSPELSEASLSGFCRQIEETWQRESSNVEYWLQVKTSSIPYRLI